MPELAHQCIFGSILYQLVLTLKPYILPQLIKSIKITETLRVKNCIFAFFITEKDRYFCINRQLDFISLRFIKVC